VMRVVSKVTDLRQHSVKPCAKSGLKSSLFRHQARPSGSVDETMGSIALQPDNSISQSCERRCDQAYESAQLEDRPIAWLHRRTVWLSLSISVIAHAGVLIALAAIVRPTASPAPQAYHLVYLLYSGSAHSQGSSASGASGASMPVAARPAAASLKVAKPLRKFERSRPIALASKIKPSAPRRAAVASELAAKRPPVSGQAAQGNGAGAAESRIAAGTGIATGIGVGVSGAGAGAFGAGPDSVFDVGQVEHPPVLKSRVMPLYPAQARRRGLDGEVVLRVIIARDGRVEKDIVVAQSSPMFDQPAIEALRQWRFEPGRDRDGRPVRVMVEVPILFRLR